VPDLRAAPVRLAGGLRGRRVMRLSWRDGLATLLVAAAAGRYALWATGAAMAGVPARWTTVIASALGMAGCTANQLDLGEVYGAAPAAPAPARCVVLLAHTRNPPGGPQRVRRAPGRGG
jgi:hypothetical protein